MSGWREWESRRRVRRGGLREGAKTYDSLLINRSASWGIQLGNRLLVWPGDREVSLFQRLHLEWPALAELLNHAEHEVHAGMERE